MADNHIVRTPTTDRQLIKVPNRLSEHVNSGCLYTDYLETGLTGEVVAQITFGPHATILRSVNMGTPATVWFPRERGIFLLSLMATFTLNTGGGVGDTCYLGIDAAGTGSDGSLKLLTNAAMVSGASYQASCLVQLNSGDSLHPFFTASIGASTWTARIRTGVLCVAA